MFYLAIRQLFSRKKQTVLILLGIFFGTLIYILIAGIQLGMREYIAEQLLNNTAHVRITGNENLISAEDLTPRFYPNTHVRWIVEPAGKRREAHLEGYQAWYERLIAHPDVMEFSPRLSVKGIAIRNNLQTSILIQGIIPSKQIKVTSTQDYMKMGSFLDIEGGGNKIILGSGVVKNLGAKLQDTINITSGLGEPRPFRIVGIVDYGNDQLDDSIAYANVRDVQQLNRTPGRISEISVALVDIDLSKGIAEEWNQINDDKVENWEEANASFMQMIQIQDIVRIVITFSILLVAAFGIYNVLSIMISQKRREIAILRAIGFQPRRILELFLIQGLLLGIGGALLGLVFGFGICKWIESIDLGFRIGKGSHLIISFEPSIYVLAFVAAIAASIVASFLPAFSASRLSPMDIIRSE